MIRCALPDNDVGYTIITTTHIFDVVEQLAGSLTIRRTFGIVNKCLPCLAYIPSGLIFSTDLLIQLLPSCFSLIIKSLVVVQVA